jgi:acetoin utilization protein AcuB
MSKPIPTIERWMTRNPRSIDHGARLSEAHAIMREEGIRHLPVMEGGKLVGILSQRDLHLIETLKDVDPERVAVHEAMTSRPYFVSPSAALVDVVAKMAAQRLGAAVVLESRRLVGIFTTVDAMSALTELLRSAQAPARRREDAGRPANAAPRRTPADEAAAPARTRSGSKRGDAAARSAVRGAGRARGKTRSVA